MGLGSMADVPEYLWVPCVDMVLLEVEGFQSWVAALVDGIGSYHAVALDLGLGV